MEIHAKIPSAASSPRNTYSTNGSIVAASFCRIPSSAFWVKGCVFVLYGAFYSTELIRVWSKKSCPTWPACAV